MNEIEKIFNLSIKVMMCEHCVLEETKKYLYWERESNKTLYLNYLN